MFAVIETCGKQYIVREGTLLKIDKLKTIKTGEEIRIDKVLYFSAFSGKNISSNISVKAEVLDHRKGNKLIIFKKRRRKNYRRKIGYRQCITVIRINKINIT